MKTTPSLVVLQTSFLWAVIALLLHTAAYSQDTLPPLPDSTRTSVWKNLKYDARNVAGGIKYAYTQPFKWDKEDVLIFGGVAAGTTLLFLADEEANTFFTKQKEGSPQLLRDFGWYFGSPQNNYGITGGIYAFGLLTNNEKIRKTGVLLISSATAAGLLQTFSKTIVGRARPGSGLGPSHFKPFANKPAYRSFPSGHTVLSFTTAYAIGKQFTNPWIRSGIYAVGLISPVSRLVEGAHWLTDVSLSIALSVAVVEGIDNYLRREEKYKYAPIDPNSKKISWNLQFGKNKIGVVGTF